MEKGKGPRVPRFKGSKVQGSKGPKYELDSTEGPSCFGLQLICYDSNFYERRNIDDTNPESDRNDKHLEENENQH